MMTQISAYEYEYREPRIVPRGGRVMVAKNDAREALIRESIRFASWGAGEGLCPRIEGVVTEPEDFLMAYSVATGDEDWETLAERVVPDPRIAELEAENAELRKLLEDLPRTSPNPYRIIGVQGMTHGQAATVGVDAMKAAIRERITTALKTDGGE